MKTILAVEDSASIRYMLCATLRNAGYQVKDASGGNEGLKIASGARVDMVITDIEMPDGDGLSLIRNLRKLSTYAGVPIVVFSTVSDEAIKQEGKAAGATAWLKKPCDPQTLLGIVSKLIGR